jgi:hypothetical protein
LRYLLFATLAGCASGPEQLGTFPPQEVRARRATEVREIAVSEADARLTSVSELAVDSRGMIYVPDPLRHRVLVLSPAGAVQRQVGRRGQGPGEFRMIRGVQVLPGDSLLVYDPELGRISVYAPDALVPAYTVSLAGKLSSGAPFTLRRTSDNNALLAVLRPGFAFGSGGQPAPRRERVVVLELDGTERRELLEYPAASRLVAASSVMQHPFGRDGFVRLDSRDRAHFAWGDTLAVTSYTLDGKRVGSFRHGHAPPAVTRQDVAAALSSLDSRTRTTFERVLADSTPERWPAVRGMIVDNRDRLWLALGGPVGSATEWASFSAEDGEYLGSLHIPSGSDALAIRNDAVYASRVDQDDVPSVVVYRINRPLR